MAMSILKDNYYSLRILVKIILVVILIQSAIGLVEFFLNETFFSTTWREERFVEIAGLKWVAIGSTARDSNHLAQNIVLIIPLAMFLSGTSSSKIHKYIYGIIIVFLAVIVIITFSRAGIAVLLIVLFLSPLQQKRVVKRSVIIYIMSALVFLYFIFFFIDSIDFNEISEKDGSIFIRSMVLLSLITAFLENPIIGAGNNMFMENAPAYLGSHGIVTDISYAPMNMYFGVLAELGFIGFILLIIIIFYSYRTIIVRFIHTKDFFYKTFYKYYLISLTGWLIMSFTLDGNKTAFFWLLITIPLMLSKDKTPYTISSSCPHAISE
jgi:O-antigen ligase